ncbi:MAG: oligosaccharide flippase family protein [Eubacteriales bacterium]|nr:oligosaccharide flippase family protein [Eubacteriales bacterium]
MKGGAKRQTLFLTAINGVVRALGLFLRVLLSRSLGAEIMGIAELAQSVHMLAITPLTSGLPMAISRMTAKAKEQNRFRPMLAGIWLVRAASVVMIPALLLLSPLLAKLMGDVRVLPSLWCSAPCILILGYSAVYNGYCYGMEQSRVPALSELVEQISRFGLTIALLTLLPKLTAPWLAAIPVFSTMIAEVVGLAFVLIVLRLPENEISWGKSWRKPVFRLAAPTTLTRVINTLLRSMAAMLIPLRLQASGLSVPEATARLGMFNGMVMPIVMLPCIFTSALTMVMLPKLAQAEEEPTELKRILLRCLYACAPVALASWLLIYSAAPLLANQVYRMAELGDLFRRSAFLAFLFAFSHVSGGVVTALGQQKRTLYGAIPISALTLGLTWILTVRPEMRLHGAILAQEIGQIASIVWNFFIVIWRRRELRTYQR